jgi:diacylglycerol kinase (ATP)
MSRRIIYIINPISGTGNKVSIREIIEAETKKAGFESFIYPSVASGDYSFLEPLIRERNITDIVIAGGDGTINQVVNSFRKFPVRFGIIPCGSGNGLAFSAGIPKNISKALQIVFTGNSQDTDAFLVNGQFACMLCGLGLDAQVAHDFADSPKRGLLTYVQKTIADFISAPSYSFILNTKGKEIRTDAFFISIANSNQFGNHFTIAPKASLTDGQLDVVIMTKQNKLSVLYNTLKQISGYNKINSVEMINENSSLIYFQTNQIEIINQGLAPMHIDGDPVETVDKLDIKVLEDTFKLIYPE